MSKVVPMDQPLSDEHRAYLRGLGANGEARERQLDQMYKPDPEALAAFNKAETDRYRAFHDTTGATSELTAAQKRIAELEALLAERDTPPPAEAPQIPDYASWLKADLEVEIDRVNTEDPEAKIAKGTKESMVTALVDYFTE